MSVSVDERAEWDQKYVLLTTFALIFFASLSWKLYNMVRWMLEATYWLCSSDIVFKKKKKKVNEENY